jgi:hypothetical protein
LICVEVIGEGEQAAAFIGDADITISGPDAAAFKIQAQLCLRGVDCPNECEKG